MNLHNQLPPRDAAALPPLLAREPRFDTATFHAAPPRSLRGVIDLTPRQSHGASAWDRANAPDAEPAAVAETPPQKTTWRRHIGNTKLPLNKLSNGELERVDGAQAKLV